MKVISINYIYFNYIKNKKKTIEGRLNTGKYSLLKKNDIIKFVNGTEFMYAKIKKIENYKSFKDYLSSVGLKRTLPNIYTIEEGIEIYRKFYNQIDEEKYGILALYIKLI